jgi:hypothetical protein
VRGSKTSNIGIYIMRGRYYIIWNDTYNTVEKVGEFLLFIYIYFFLILLVLF